MRDTRERNRLRKRRSGSLEWHGRKWRNPFRRSHVKDKKDDIGTKAVRSAHKSLLNSRVSLGNAYPGGQDEQFMMSGALPVSDDSSSAVTSATRSKVGKPSARDDEYNSDGIYLPGHIGSRDGVLRQASPRRRRNHVGEVDNSTSTPSLHSAKTTTKATVDADEATTVTRSGVPSEPYTGSHFTGGKRTLRNDPPSERSNLGGSIDSRAAVEGRKASDRPSNPALNKLKKVGRGASTDKSSVNSVLDTGKASGSVSSKSRRLHEHGGKYGHSDAPGIPNPNPAVSRTAAAAVKAEDETSFDSSNNSRKSILRKIGVQGEKRFEPKRVAFADDTASSRKGKGSGQGQTPGSTSTEGTRLRGDTSAVREQRSPESGKKKVDLLRNVIDPEFSKRREQSPNRVRTNERDERSSVADRTNSSNSTNWRDKESTKASTKASRRRPLLGDDNPDSGSDDKNSSARQPTVSGTTISTATPPRIATQHVEALCAYPGCGDWIYVDPVKYESVEVNQFPPEFCNVCGLPWPAGQPFTEEMEEAIRRRLKNSKIKDVYCTRHAMEMGRKSAGVEEKDEDEDEDRDVLDEESEGIDDEQENVTTRNDTGRDKGTQTDHYCKPMNFERYNGKMGLSSRANRLKFSGKKKALLIGINYSGQKGELRGCRTDVQNMYHYLVSNGYRDDDIDILLDIWPFTSPERENILEHLTRLIDNARPGDSLFLHYSGHGDQIEDLNGDEKDGLDECIFPVDHRSKGKIEDDILHKIIVKLPKGAQLTALFDSCHSGSILDLPYELKTKYGWLSRNGKLHHEYAPDENDALENCGRIILWSGCRDKQTSAETKIDGKAVGAMSHAFIDANWLLQQRNKRKKLFSLRRDKGYTYSELLDLIRAKLSEKSQQAQLSASWELVTKNEKVTI